MTMLTPADQATLVSGIAAVIALVLARLLQLWFPALFTRTKSTV